MVILLIQNISVIFLIGFHAWFIPGNQLASTKYGRRCSYLSMHWMIDAIIIR